MGKRRIISVFTAVLIALSAIFSVAGLAFPVKAADIEKEYTYQAVPKDDRTWVKTGDGTWTMDLDGDGHPDVTLTRAIVKKEVKSYETWTYSFNVEDDQQQYYVYEQMLKGDHSSYGGNHLAPGYSGQGEDDKLAIEEDPGHLNESTHSYTIVNSKDHTPSNEQTGSLTISKHMEGEQINPDQEFTFVISLSVKDSGDSTSSTSDLSDDEIESGSTDTETSDSDYDTSGDDDTSSDDEEIPDAETLKSKISGSQIFGDTPFMDGKAVISMKAEGSQTISGIPAGLHYTVEEKPVSGYTQTASEENKGTIHSNRDIEVKFTNKANSQPSTYPKMYVPFKLKVEEKGIPNDEYVKNGYRFHIALSGLVPGMKYTYGEQREKSYVADAEGKADVTVTLKKGKEISFDKLPAGSAKYQVMEEAGPFTQAYKVENANNSGTIVQPKDEAIKPNASLATSVETADEGEDITVTFTNTFASVQTLTLRKFIEEEINGKTASSDHDSENYKNLEAAARERIDKDAQTEYEFTVNFYNLPEDAEIYSDLGKITPDEYSEGMKTFKLKADGTKVVFRNIPAGTTYRITETQNEAKPSFTIAASDSQGKALSDKVIQASGEGSSNTALETGKNDEDEELSENESDTVTFTNNVKPVKLPVTGQKGIYGGIAVALILIAAGVIFLFKKKKTVHKDQAD